MAKRLVALTSALVGVGVGVASGVASPAFGLTGDADGAESGGDGLREGTAGLAPSQIACQADSGVRLGLLQIKPSLAMSAGYSDNYAASEVARESSTVYNISAALGISSDWSRHALNASIAVPSTVYEDHYTSTNYSASLGGRLDVDRSASITGGLNYRNMAESLGFADSALTLREPARSQAAGANLGVSKTFNRLHISADVSYSANDYQDVELANNTTVSADSRDAAATSYGLRAGVSLSDSTNIFVSASMSERDHELDPPDIAVNRDSRGTQYMAGVSFDISRVASGEISAGVFEQTYDQPGVAPQTGMAAHAQVEWLPDELLTITLGANRSIQESNTADAATVVGVDVDLALSYAFRRNLSFGLSLGYSDDEYVEIDRTDRRWEASANFAYELRDGVAVTLAASHSEQESTGLDLGRNYGANVSLIGIRLSR
jgi:hypothetical protein